MVNKNSLVSFYTILLLIILQGIIGWYMVKSGLVERTDVSHYRLSLHLVTAFIIFILLLWNYLRYANHKIAHGNKKHKCRNCVKEFRDPEDLRKHKKGCR